MSDCLSVQRRSRSARWWNNVSDRSAVGCRTSLGVCCATAVCWEVKRSLHGLPTNSASQKCVFMRTPYPYQHTSALSKFKNEISADNLTAICDALLIHLSGVNRSVNVFWCIFASWGTLTARQQCLTYTSAFLLGFGCSKTSVCFMILSVQSLVFSARTKRFSKWASNSVFSA